jgi:trimeric autotransporter adhesin
MAQAFALSARLKALVFFALLLLLPAVGACGRSELEGPSLRSDAGSDAAIDGGADAETDGSTTEELLGLSPDPTPVLLAVGESLQLRLMARFASGLEADVAARATWTSAVPSTATAVTGLVSGVAAGKTTVEATWGGLSVQVPVEIVASKPVRLDVTPAVVTVGVDASETLRAFAVFADGRSTDVSTSAVWQSSDATVASVQGGTVRGVATGSAVVAATFDGLTGRANVAVTASAVLTVRVDPATQTITVGSTGNFTATAIYANGAQADVTAQAAWIASAPATAASTVAGTFTGLTAGATEVSATFSGVTGKASLTVIDATTVTGITVAPNAATLAPGASQRFTATATRSDGTTLDVTASAVWTTDNASIATVSSAVGSEGEVQAVSPGNAVVSATFGGQSGRANVTVQSTSVVLTGITITPSPVTVAYGASTQLRATGTYSNGTTQDITATVNWSTSAPAIAPVSQGVVSGLSAGAAVVTATLGGVSAAVNVTVTAAPLRSLTVTIVTPSTIDVGGTTSARAVGTFADGSSSDVTEQCAWSTADAAIATVSNTSGARGAITGTGAGVTAISATLQGVSGRANVTVRTPITYRLVIAPASASIVVGATQAFTATRVGSDGSQADVSNSASWSSSSLTVATISGATATAVNPGSTTITATAGGLTGTASLTVTARPLTPTGLTIAPTTASIAVGAATTFVATLSLSDGTTQDVTATATWSSSAAGVATVSAGRATGVAAGTATITATASGFSATATVSVSSTPPGIVSLTMSPPGGTLNVGATRAITVTATFADGSSQNVTAQATFSSTATSVATMSGGTLTGVAAGTTTVLASYNGLTASGSWTVIATTPTITSIVVVLNPTTVDVAGTSNAIATAVYSDGSRRDVTATATWASSQTGVATVQTGRGVVVRGVAGGTSSISATLGGVTGQATITVRAPTLTNLLIIPTSATMGIGDTRTFSAQAVYSNNTTVDVTSQGTWVSTSPNVATVSDAAGTKGTVTAVASGTSSIQVTFGGRTATAQVTVARITGIQIRITNLTNVPNIPFVPPLSVGQNFQFYAMAQFSNNTTQDVTSLATWTSSNPSVLFANDSGAAKGQVTAISRGTAQVRAAYQGFNAQQNVTVR